MTQFCSRSRPPHGRIKGSAVEKHRKVSGISRFGGYLQSRRSLMIRIARIKT